MKISQVVIMFIALGTSVVCTYAQKTMDFKTVRIDKKLPTVFLQLERRAYVSQIGGTPKASSVWLRLRNNSRWTIRTDASGGSGTEDARLYYETLDRGGNIQIRRRCHVCSIVDLAPGRSIVFNVPHDDLKDATFLRVQFSFGWEDAVSVAPAHDEPTHFVYFRVRSLTNNDN